MKVQVYKNLTRDCYSIRAAEGEHQGKVVGHADLLVLKMATFTVQAGGRERVRATGRKQVHAWVDGHLLAWSGKPFKGRLTPSAWVPLTDEDLLDIRYNPMRDEAFHVEGVPVAGAPTVWFLPGHVLAREVW